MKIGTSKVIKYILTEELRLNNVHEESLRTICCDNVPIKYQEGQRKEHMKSRVSLTRSSANARILLKLNFWG